MQSSSHRINRRNIGRPSSWIVIWRLEPTLKSDERYGCSFRGFEHLGNRRDPDKIWLTSAFDLHFLVGLNPPFVSYGMDPAQRRIGVVIPSYKSGESLRWTLDSIAAQSLKPDEVCVVFDGEDPVGEAVVRDHAVVTETIVREECSGGAAQPRNDGWNRIGRRVDYIHFLDSDDLIAPWFYEDLSRVLDEDRSVCGVRAGHFVMSDEEIVKCHGAIDWEQLERGSSDSIRDENYVDVHPVPHSFVLLRSDAVSRNEIDGSPWRGCRANSPDGKQEFMEDMDFVFRLLTFGRFVTVDGASGVYNVRVGSVSDDTQQTYLWALRAYDFAIIPWVRQHPDPKVRRVARRMRAVSVRKYARSEPELGKAMAVLCKEILRAPRLKTVGVAVLILAGVDSQRKKLLSQRHHRSD